MRALLNRLGDLFFRKLAFYVLVSVLGLSTYAVWLFVHERVDASSHRFARIVGLAGRRDELQAQRDALVKQLVAFQSELPVQESRAKQADTIILQLHGMESWWDRLAGNRAQQKANAEQVVRLKDIKEAATGRSAELRSLIGKATKSLASVDVSLRHTRLELAEVHHIQSPAMLYLNEAWHRGKVALIILLLMGLCARTVGKIVFYYGVASVIVRGRPVRLAQVQEVAASANPIKGTVEMALWPGESLWVKRGSFQSSPHEITQGRRLLLNWRIPLTCVACGLTWMITLRNRFAGGGRQVTLANVSDARVELTMVDVPDGSSIVLRPGFLAGVITSTDQPLVIRRRWPVFIWQVWVMREFRFLEFLGPCRLLVAGRNGVRPERLITQEGQPVPVRRIEQEIIIGFTPTLDYQPVRAVSFWNYYRGRVPLFSRLLSGSGLCLLQEKPSARTSEWFSKP